MKGIVRGHRLTPIFRVIIPYLYSCPLDPPLLQCLVESPLIYSSSPSYIYYVSPKLPQDLLVYHPFSGFIQRQGHKQDIYILCKLLEISIIGIYSRILFPPVKGSKPLGKGFCQPHKLLTYMTCSQHPYPLTVETLPVVPYSASRPPYTPSHISVILAYPPHHSQEETKSLFRHIFRLGVTSLYLYPSTSYLLHRKLIETCIGYIDPPKFFSTFQLLSGHIHSNYIF